MKRFRDIASERTRALHEFKFFGAFISRMQFFSTEEVPTLAVDKYARCYVNEKFWYGSPFEHRVGFIIHESQHPMRNHFGRAEAAAIPPLEANICQDAEINDGGKIRRFLPHRNIIYPENFGWPVGKMFEEYWQLMQQQRDANPGGYSSGSENGSPFPGDDASVANGDCGSGATGQRADYELPAPSEGGPGIDESDMEVIRRQVAQDIQEAESRSRGSTGGSAAMWAQSVLAPPKIPWQSKLKANARNFRNWIRGRSTTNYSRPSRRNCNPRTLVRPGSIDPVPNLAILVDTSGSMGGSIGTAVLSEVQGCLKAGAGNAGTVLVCDAKMQGLRKVKRVSAMDFKGGGGTDMRIGIEAAASLKERPDYLVILTDGYTPWPQLPPRHMKVIIGLIGTYKASIDSCPSWATVIDIPSN